MRAIIIGIFCLAALGAHGAAAGKSPTAAVTHIWFESPPEIAEGGRLINEGKIEEGMKLIRRVLDHDLPSDARAFAYTNLCGGYLELNKYTKAIRTCRRAIKRNSRIWQALSNRGVARFELGRFDGAVEDFRRAIKLDPENEALKKNLALAEQGQRSIILH